MKHPSTYLKMMVLGAVENAQGQTIRERIKNTASLHFTDEEGNTRSFTWRTISTWLYRYKSRGVTGVTLKSRADKGKPRKITPEELMEAINQVMPLFVNGRHTKAGIYRACIDRGIVRKDLLAPTTFYRFVKEYDLLSTNIEHNRKRLAFAMEHANDLWQADTMFGPHVKDHTGKKIQTKLIAFIDDASRVICHGQFFFNENIDSMITTLKSAFYKRGIPKQLYVDNGSIYVSHEITLICARVGTILRHTPVRDGASKGKIERFFRRVRDQFLSRVLDLSSLAALNRQFHIWVEEEYNATTHSTLGMSPVNRFSLDTKFINFLPPNQLNDELFYAEDTRTVKKDNTFSFSSMRYEPDTDLRSREITIRFDRARKDSRIAVYYRNQRMGTAVPVDMVANSRLKRKGGDL